jgi:hypothetical protein
MTAPFTSDMSCMACMGPVFYSDRDGSMGNAYTCVTHAQHVDCCIMCAYTYFRTKLINDEPLKCYDPKCTRVFDLNEHIIIAKCSLNADEFSEFLKRLNERLLKRGEAARNTAVKQVTEDSLDTVTYAAHYCKRCPDCLVRVEKVSGCDDVQCQHCGTRFEFSKAVNFLDNNELKRRQDASSSLSSSAAATRRDQRKAARDVLRLTYFPPS